MEGIEMVVRTPVEACECFGLVARKDNIEGTIFMVGEYVVEIHIGKPTPFTTTHIPYPFDTKEA